MLKNCIISVLLAGEIVRFWSPDCRTEEIISLVTGIAACLFIFLLFLEEVHEKRMKYRKRVRKIRDTVRKLRLPEQQEMQGENYVYGRRHSGKENHGQQE